MGNTRHHIYIGHAGFLCLTVVKLVTTALKSTPLPRTWAYARKFWCMEGNCELSTGEARADRKFWYATGLRYIKYCTAYRRTESCLEIKNPLSHVSQWINNAFTSGIWRLWDYMRSCPIVSTFLKGLRKIMTKHNQESRPLGAEDNITARNLKDIPIWTLRMLLECYETRTYTDAPTWHSPHYASRYNCNLQ